MNSRLTALLLAYGGYLIGSLLYGGATHYHALDLTAYASVEDIKSNYRRLARRDHPDKVVPSQKELAQARFVKLQAAHETLSSSEKRSEYDAELAEQTADALPWERAFFWASLWLWEVTLLSGVLAVLLSGSDLVEAWKRRTWLAKRAKRAAAHRRGGGSEVVEVSSSGWHTVVVAGGAALTWGRDELGQCGRGAGSESHNRPGGAHGLLEGVIAASAGQSHTLFVTEEGTAWGTGDNSHGQLGTGDTVSKSTAVKLSLPPAITQQHAVVSVAAGRAHSLVLLRDGLVLGCGSNEYGQLGCGKDGAKRKRLALLPGLERCLCEQVHCQPQPQPGTVAHCQPQPQPRTVAHC